MIYTEQDEPFLLPSELHDLEAEEKRDAMHAN